MFVNTASPLVSWQRAVTARVSFRHRKYVDKVVLMVSGGRGGDVVFLATRPSLLNFHYKPRAESRYGGDGSKRNKARQVVDFAAGQRKYQ